MDIGALAPDDPRGEGSDLDPQHVEAIFALLKRFGEGKGKGGKLGSPAAPPVSGGGEGKGAGGTGLLGGVLAVP
eukprot:7738305-Alexandrium_andersonii.AAC.1